MLPCKPSNIHLQVALSPYPLVCNLTESSQVHEQTVIQIGDRSWWKLCVNILQNLEAQVFTAWSRALVTAPKCLVKTQNSQIGSTFKNQQNHSPQFLKMQDDIGFTPGFLLVWIRLLSHLYVLASNIPFVPQFY